MKHLLAPLAFLAPTIMFAPTAFADDAATCAAVDNIIASNNVGAPFMVDAITRSEMAINDCATKTADFNWSVLTNQSEMADNWRDIVGTTFRNGFCAREDLASVVRAGWRINATWTTNDGQVYSTTLACP